MRIVAVVLGLCLTISLRGEPARDWEVLERFAVLGDGDLLIVPVTIKGKQYPFVVDTGATTAAYDTSLVPLLGPRVDFRIMQGADVPVVAADYQPPEAYLGKLPLPRDRPVPVYDLTDLRSVTGQDIRGFVGIDFLRRYVVRIDFDNGVLTLQKGLGPAPGQPVPLHFEGNESRPFVDARICSVGPAERFLVDLGYGGISGRIQAGLFATLEQMGQLEEVGQGMGTSIGYLGHVVDGRLAALQMGSLTHRRLILSRGHDSLLGLGFWCRYCATFDFPGGKVYLRKGRRFDAPDLSNRSGLHIHRPAGETVVAVVDAGSVGEKAGIKPGDVLVHIAGTRVNQERLLPLRKRFCAAGQTLPLTLKRGDKLFAVSLRLP